MFIEIIKAILYGIIEGITEWLPISSTGHLILLNEFMGLDVGAENGPVFVAEFWEMFEVVIQLGAILAVAVMFFRKLNPFAPSLDSARRRGVYRLWLKILVASLPAAVVGIIFDKIIENMTGKDIDGWLYNAWTVAAALIVYGVLFIVIERAHKDKASNIGTVEDISYRTAFLMGMFQVLAIIPGTSRSGSTILGAILIGTARPVAAEFSFFMALPAIAGASLIKAYGFYDYVTESGVSVPLDAWVVLAVACAVAFFVSVIAIKFLMEYVKRHTFSSFGVYRIILGAAVLLVFALI